jgi:hypothetical protein
MRGANSGQPIAVVAFVTNTKYTIGARNLTFRNKAVLSKVVAAGGVIALLFFSWASILLLNLAESFGLRR